MKIPAQKISSLSRLMMMMMMATTAMGVMTAMTVAAVKRTRGRDDDLRSVHRCHTKTCRKAPTLRSGQLYLRTRTVINSALVNTESFVSLWKSCIAIKL